MTRPPVYEKSPTDTTTPNIAILSHYRDLQAGKACIAIPYSLFGMNQYVPIQLHSYVVKITVCYYNCQIQSVAAICIPFLCLLLWIESKLFQFICHQRQPNQHIYHHNYLFNLSIKIVNLYALLLLQNLWCIMVKYYSTE